jgi:hypothetical protein
MERVSSNSTLFFVIFLPVFWTVFFGAITAALMLQPFAFIGNIPSGMFRIGLGFFYLSGLALFYFTLLRLRRVEIGQGFVYVTNYFKNFRYPYHNVERIETSTFLFLHIGTVTLKKPGYFGRRILFLPAMGRLRSALKANPELPGDIPLL